MRETTVVILAVLSGLVLSLPLLWLSNRYLQWPGLAGRWKTVLLLLIALPLASYALIRGLIGIEHLPWLMGVIFVGWLVEVGRGWRKAKRSGIHLRLQRSRFQKYNLGLALGMLLLLLPAASGSGSATFLLTMLIWLTMQLFQGLLPNAIAGAGVFLNGALIPWKHVERVSWRSGTEALVMHTRGRFGSGQLAVPVPMERRNALDELLQQVHPTANYSPIAGS